MSLKRIQSELNEAELKGLAVTSQLPPPPPPRSDWMLAAIDGGALGAHWSPRGVYAIQPLQLSVRRIDGVVIGRLTGGPFD